MSRRNEFMESMKCRKQIGHDVRISFMVHVISEFLNTNEVTYDEFCEIINIIDHYTHHEAELIQHSNEIEYKNEHNLPYDYELDSDEMDYEDIDRVFVDIDDEDGIWFEIPVIG